MEIVQRILNKIVGQDVSADEMEQVSGGVLLDCGMEGWVTYSETSIPRRLCDYDN